MVQIAAHRTNYRLGDPSPQCSHDCEQTSSRGVNKAITSLGAMLKVRRQVRPRSQLTTMRYGSE